MTTPDPVPKGDPVSKSNPAAKHELAPKSERPAVSRRVAGPRALQRTRRVQGCRYEAPRAPGRTERAPECALRSRRGCLPQPAPGLGWIVRAIGPGLARRLRQRAASTAVAARPGVRSTTPLSVLPLLPPSPSPPPSKPTAVWRCHRWGSVLVRPHEGGLQHGERRSSLGPHADDMLVVVGTAPAGTAQTLARSLVNEGLVVWVHLVPGLKSFCPRQGEADKDPEVLLIMTSTRAKLSLLEARCLQGRCKNLWKGAVEAVKAEEVVRRPTPTPRPND